MVFFQMALLTASGTAGPSTGKRARADEDLSTEALQSAAVDGATPVTKQQRLPASKPGPDESGSQGKQPDQVTLPSNTGCIVNVRSLLWLGHHISWL